MTNYFAELDDNNTVLRVLVGGDDATEAKRWLLENLSGRWLQTFKDGTRGQYASIGFTYDEELDAFIPPKPSEDAILDEATFSWVVPEVEEEDEA